MVCYAHCLFFKYKEEHYTVHKSVSVTALLPDWSIDKYQDVKDGATKWEDILNQNCSQPSNPTVQEFWDKYSYLQPELLQPPE